MRSWLTVAPDSPFPVQNLPYGVFSYGDEAPRVGVAVGDHVIDLASVAAAEGLDGAQVFQEPVLNPLMALGRPAWSAIRSWLQELLTHEAYRDLVEPHLVARDDVHLHLPFEVADFVDFYSSRDHAENVGRLFRPDADPLLPNWKHLPVAYHGRAGTVIVSGTHIVRPSGQVKPRMAPPAHRATLRLDIEAEVGFVVGVPSLRGEPTPIEAFRDHVFGVCLVNDWSARDIQAWEYQPLGPFLGKSFATSISPWVVPLDALEAARVAPPAQDPPVLPYLREPEPWGLDITLEISWNGTVVSRPPFAGMYWTTAQQFAHLTVNGASLRTGDLYASGTVSGPAPDERGSFLELSWNGAQPVSLGRGVQRDFLEDGDEVTITGWAPGADGVRIGFGEVTGRVVPANRDPVRLNR